LGLLSGKDKYSKQKVEIDFVVILPECSAAPMGLLTSFALVGNSRLEKTLMSARTNAQQVPSPFSAKKYFPRGMARVRSVLTGWPQRRVPILLHDVVEFRALHRIRKLSWTVTAAVLSRLKDRRVHHGPDERLHQWSFCPFTTRTEPS
jgi:hypothetical protein